MSYTIAMWHVNQTIKYESFYQIMSIVKVAQGIYMIWLFGLHDSVSFLVVILNHIIWNVIKCRNLYILFLI